jgi:hypothetical protein
VTVQAEEWRVIAEFPDYAASSEGRIKRIANDQRNHRVSGQPLRPAVSASGYAGVTLCLAGSKKNVRVNRVVCEAFHGPAPSAEYHAAHLDGDRLNNRASNLCWKLPVDNEADKRVHGTARIGDKHWSKSMPERRARGEGHGRTTLTESDVRAIRADTRFQRVIAADFGVSQKAVWSIKAGKTWGHVQ